jgi:hypothetical protein
MRLVFAIAILIGLVGVLTATDLVSLREVARALSLPVASGAVLGVRQAMPNGLAHLLEVIAALAGPLAASSVLAWSRLSSTGWAGARLAFARSE